MKVNQGDKEIYFVVYKNTNGDCLIPHVFFYETKAQAYASLAQGWVEGTLMLVRGVIEVEREAGEGREFGLLG